MSIIYLAFLPSKSYVKTFPNQSNQVFFFLGEGNRLFK